MILLTGFGPFPGVAVNPSATLVRAAHGWTVAGHAVEGLVLPVSWGVASRAAIDAALRTRPALILGFGVASQRTEVAVETTGLPARAGLDVDGRAPTAAPALPVAATVDLPRLAEALGCGTSDDAGSYLCNAWAQEVVAAVPCPAAFIHLPPEGLPVARLMAALRRYLAP